MGAFAFARSLRSNIEKATNQGPPWGDVNPLVVIGLTEAILDLNLGEDQIYAVVRSFVRQLAAQVHPDRNLANVSSDRQRQIIEALDFLDDRQNFSKALDDFRNLKAEDRREMGTLRNTLTNLRREIADFQDQLESLNDGRRLLQEQQTAFERRKVEDPVQAPILKEMLEKTEKNLTNTERDAKEKAERLAEWKERFYGLTCYIGHMGKKSSLYPEGIFAFNVRWVAVASLWTVKIVRNPSPIDDDGCVRSESYKEILRVVKKKSSVESVIAGWKEMVETLVTDETLGSKALPLGLSIIEFRDGKASLAFGHRHVLPSEGRMVGSLPPDKVPVTRALLSNQPSHLKVFETLNPFIIPGGLLVFVQNPETSTASPLILPGGTYPPVRFSAKRVVLAVG